MDILSVLTNNPISRPGNGYQKSTWIDIKQTQTGSVQGFTVSVFGNDGVHSRINAQSLLSYILGQFPKHEISVGLRHPKGNESQLIILWGKNLHVGSFAPKKKPKPPTQAEHSFDSEFGQGFNK